MKHEPIVGDNLPRPAGPYAPGVTYERLIFVSGQGAKNPETGKLAGPDVESQTEQIFKNIVTILEAAGSSLQHVLRCGVFLIDIRDFAKMNTVYEKMMAGNKAARTTVCVSALPAEGLRVEIDAVAYIPWEEL